MAKRTETETFYSFSSLDHAAEHLPARSDHGQEQSHSPGRGQVRPRPLRGQAGFLQEQGRHAGADVHRPSQGHQARRQQPHAALRLRRIQHRHAADVFDQPRGVDGDGRGLRPGQPSRRRRIWRGLAPGRHEAQEAECVRRLHRRRRVADRQQVHADREAGHSGRQQRRPIGRRGR